jgi:hypothetical protein
MVLRRYALSIIALAILESGQWLKTKKDILVGVFFVLPSVTDENRKGTPLNAHGILGRNEG